MKINKIIAASCTAAVMTCTAGAATAATTITQVIDIQRAKPSDQSITLFDTNLGTLQSISFGFSYANAGDYTVHNPDPVPVTGANRYSSVIRLKAGSDKFSSLVAASTLTQRYGSITYSADMRIPFILNAAIVDGSLIDRDAMDLAALSAPGGGQSGFFPFIDFDVLVPGFSRGRSDISFRHTESSGTLSIAYNYDDLTSAVPEPAIWAMMLTGFGLIGGAMRRRQRNARRVAFA